MLSPYVAHELSSDHLYASLKVKGPDDICLYHVEEFINESKAFEGALSERYSVSRSRVGEYCTDLPHVAIQESEQTVRSACIEALRAAFYAGTRCPGKLKV